MFCSPIPSIFRIFNEINDSKWRFQDGGYFAVKNVIVTSLLLLMTNNLLSCTRILSDMLLLRLCGYTSNREEILINDSFSANKIG